MVPGFKGRRLVDIAAGSSHSAAVDEAGALWTWGCGEHGELGHAVWEGDEEWYAKTPTMVATLAHKRIRHVSVGVCHTLAVTAAGELYACGDNGHLRGIPSALGLGFHDEVLLQLDDRTYRQRSVPHSFRRSSASRCAR